MKQLMLAVLILGMTIPSLAAIKEKDVIGTWKYKVETDQGDLTGTISIEKMEGKLMAKVNTDDGQELMFNKIELKDDDVLYMELDTGYEILELTLTVKGKAMEGTVGNEQGSYPITCEKVE